MKFGSVCSGIEAASVAWHPLGWTPVAFSEIEKFPCAVLAHHYPTVPNLGDMTTMDVEPLGDIDILVGGTPCQAFSVAGLRQSLDDARGNLTLSYVRLVHELVEQHGLRNSVWENVPGVLSTKDNAFGCFLGALVGSDDPLDPPGGKRWPNAGMVAGPKGRAAWRILDAQYFGVAQRRRRVFVVGDFGNGADPAAVLFEREGVPGNPAPRREPGKNVAPTISTRPTSNGGLGTDFDLDNGLIKTSILRNISDYGPGMPVLRAKGGDAGDGSEVLLTQEYNNSRTSGPINVTTALAAHGVRMDFEVETFIAQTVALRGREGGGTAELGGDIATALRASTGGGDKPHVLTHAIQAGALRTNPLSGPDNVGVQADIAYTLEARAEVQAVSVTGEITHTLKAEGFDASEDGTGRGNPIVAFSSKDYGADVGELAPTLRAGGHDGSHANAGVPPAIVFQSKASHHQSMNPAEVAPSLDVGKSDGMATFYGSAVRRLTPVECERLQGFPDDYTRIPMPKKGKKVGPVWAADGPRYKALGNSMAVPVMHWIGARIDRLMPVAAAAPKPRFNFGRLA